MRRLVLEAGLFPPPVRPVSERELADLLTIARDRALDRSAPAYADGGEFDRLEWWLGRFARGGGGIRFQTCECRTNPVVGRISGRALAGFTDLGDGMVREAGLAWHPGWNAVVEPAVEIGAGRWWLAAGARLAGPIGASGTVLDGRADPLAWPGWSVPTGRVPVRAARTSAGAWRVDAPRAAAGVALGSWALGAGWAPRAQGPGLSGSLQLDHTAPSFPALTVRRTRPFVWGGGVWRTVSPAELQVTAGPLDRRTIAFREGDAVATREARAWFFGWRLGWEVGWFRTAVSHSSVAAARDGNLWPDLLRINFPTKGTTEDEVESGPVTDRLLAMQFEVRWREAPWPLLPRAAGRLFWDYGGTDSLPSGPGGVVPRIAAPASVIGCELMSPRWDLAAEYAELEHASVLWYGNGGFPGTGYSHEDWVLGHPLGGSGERVGGLVRWRTAEPCLEAALELSRSTWGLRDRTPGSGRRDTAALTLARDPGAGAGDEPAPLLLWSVTLEVHREIADPASFAPDPSGPEAAERTWWRLFAEVGL